MRGAALLVVALVTAALVLLPVSPPTAERWDHPSDAGPHLMPPDPRVYAFPPHVVQRAPLPPSSPVQTSGLARALVLLIDFQDIAANLTHDAAYFEGLYNAEGPTAGSLRSYYQEVSFGSLTVNATIVPTWWRSSRTMAYYGEDTGSGVDNANGPIYRLVVEAVQAADPTVDFRRFDADNDGVVDHVIVVHAGGAQEEDPSNTDLIWSHRWAVHDADPLTPGSQSLRADGVQIYGYIMAGESSPVGVAVHEFGHELGLPDLYDVDGSSLGVGVWDVMGSGAWLGFPRGASPAHLSAWSRIRLGWAAVTDVSVPLIAESIPAVARTGTVYRLPIRTSTFGSEYFLIENRQPIGFDAALPGFGLLIWHVDDARANNDDESHRLVDLEEADEATSGDRPIDSADPWRDTAVGFGPDTMPNSHAYNGEETGWRVRDISASGDPMTATIAKAIGRDLAVSEIRMPSHAQVGEMVTAEAIVHNDGLVPEDVDLAVRVYFERLDAADVVRTEGFLQSALLPGLSASFAVPFVPDRTGRFLVRATLQFADDDIRSNNERVAHILSNRYAFRDDIESGPGGWTLDGTETDPHRWMVVDQADPNGSAHSPTKAWRFGHVPTLLPNPLPPRWHTLTSPEIDLPGGPTFLVFYHRYDLSGRPEPPLILDPTESDVGYAEVRTFDGSWGPWTALAEYRGRDLAWRGVSIDLTARVSGASSLQVRFNVSSDILPRSGGWWVDDVMIAQVGLGRAVVLLAPDGPIRARPGEEVLLDVKVANVGDFEDTVVLNATLPAGWTAVVRADATEVPLAGRRIALASDRDFSVLVFLRIPSDAPTDRTHPVALRATSESDATAGDVHTITVVLGTGGALDSGPLWVLVLVAALIVVVLAIALLVARSRRPRT